MRIYISLKPEGKEKWPNPKDLQNAASVVTRALYFQNFQEERAEAVHDHIVITMKLSPGEQFCEKAIALVGRIMYLFGIQDKDGRLVGNFNISQTTHILRNGRWETYADVLRKKLRLQGPYIYCWTN